MSNAQDLQLLGGNYGFVGNNAPVITPVVGLTHVDLTTRIDLSKLAVDSEGDKIAFAVKAGTHGQVEIGADGKYAIFTPDSGFGGTAGFELVASDGVSSSQAHINVNVSTAALVNLGITNRNPKLTVGDKYQLGFVGDFVDQKGVSLTTDYLSYGIINSSQPNVLTIDSHGLIIAIGDGTGVITASRDGISTFTASRVGKFDPQTDGELNVAIAEEQGLHVYPEAVTLIPGVTRRIQVSIEGQPTTPELLTDSTTGTKYFVSNPNILDVTSEGMITAKASGVANVTVINGGAEVIIPVLVELPHPSGSTLGTNGGAVRAADGAIVTIAPGALASNTPVSIQQLRQDQLTVPISDQFNFVGAFKLDVGTEDLTTPVQLALPAPVGAVVGQEVFFMRQDTITLEPGVPRPIWIVVESGRVGADNLYHWTEFWSGYQSAQS